MKRRLAVLLALFAMLLTCTATVASADRVKDIDIADPVRLCEMLGVGDTSTGTGEVVLPSHDPESLTETELFTCGKSADPRPRAFTTADDPIDTDVVAGTVSSSWHIATVTGRKQVGIQTRVSVNALDGFRDFTAKYRVTYKPQGGEAVTVDVTVEISHEAGPVQGTTTVFGKEAFTAVPAGIPAGATVTVDLLKESTGKVRDILAGDPPKFKKLELKQSKQIGPSRTTP